MDYFKPGLRPLASPAPSPALTQKMTVAIFSWPTVRFYGTVGVPLCDQNYPEL